MFKKTMFVTTLATMLLFLSGTAYGDAKLVKSCTTTLPVVEEGDEPLVSLIEIYSSGATVSAKVTQRNEVIHETAKILELKVMAGLAPDMDDVLVSQLNTAEEAIYQALRYEADPALQGIFTSGLDLAKVRSAKLYIFGEPSMLGPMIVVEAKDINGEILGSFIGGFILRPCE